MSDLDLEKESLRGSCKAMGEDIKKLKREINKLKRENADLRNKLELQEMLGTPEQFLAAKDADRYRAISKYFVSDREDMDDDVVDRLIALQRTVNGGGVYGY